MKVNFICIIKKNTTTQPNSSNYSFEKTDGHSDAIVLKKWLELIKLGARAIIHSVFDAACGPEKNYVK